MNIELSKEEMRLIKISVNAHINQCTRFIESCSDEREISKTGEKIQKLRLLRDKL